VGKENNFTQNAKYFFLFNFPKAQLAKSPKNSLRTKIGASDEYTPVLELYRLQAPVIFFFYSASQISSTNRSKKYTELIKTGIRTD